MAAATVTTTVTKQWADSTYHVFGTLAVGANPLEYTTGGIAMNLNQAAVKASRTPIRVTVVGQAGFVYEYDPGTDNSNGKLLIRAQTNGAAEDDPLGQLAAAAIPAACSGDSITFEAVYAGQL
jgi:hypothetical protein